MTPLIHAECVYPADIAKNYRQQKITYKKEVNFYKLLQYNLRKYLTRMQNFKTLFWFHALANYNSDVTFKNIYAYYEKNKIITHQQQFKFTILTSDIIGKFKQAPIKTQLLLTYAQN